MSLAHLKVSSGLGLGKRTLLGDFNFDLRRRFHLRALEVVS